MYYIKEVKSRREGHLFTEFPNKLLKNYQAFVPALSMDENNVFNPKTNPAFKYCEAIRFLAYDANNKVVGRIAGIINHQRNKDTNAKTARFSRIDMIDDITVTELLTNTVIAWAQSKGMDTLIGPIGFSDFDRMGLLVDGFEYDNLFITIYNLPYYQHHLEKLGFIKDVDWLERRIIWPTQVPEKITKVSNLVQKRYGYKLKKFKNKKEIDFYAVKAFEVYNDAFMQLYGFHPLNREMMKYYIDQVKLLIQLEYAWLVLDSRDEVVAFGVVMPSLAAANKKNNGHLFPFGWIRLLKALKKTDILDFYFIAVDPKHQARGVLSLIMEDCIAVGIKNGVKFAETGPELEENHAIHAQWQSFESHIHKRRRCYTRSIK